MAVALLIGRPFKGMMSSRGEVLSQAHLVQNQGFLMILLFSKIACLRLFWSSPCRFLDSPGRAGPKKDVNFRFGAILKDVSALFRFLHQDLNENVP